MLKQLQSQYDEHMRKLQDVADSYGEVSINSEDLAMLRKLTADIMTHTYKEAYSKAMDECAWGSVYLG